MELDPGIYVVRMKVTATKIYTNPTIDHMLKYHVHNRQEKLIQVAMSYDLAHAKGVTVDIEEQKQRDAEKQGMDATNTAKMRTTIDPIAFNFKQRFNAEKKAGQKRTEDAEKRITQMLKVEQKVRNDLEDNLMEGQGLHSSARLNKAKSHRRNRNKNKFHNGTRGFQQEYCDLEDHREGISYGNFNGTQTMQDRISVVNHSQAFRPQRPAYRRPIYQNHMRVMSQNRDRATERSVPTLSSLLSETAYTFNSPRNDRDQDGETWSNDSDCSGSDPDPHPHPHAADPWNAVCVVGLRVYTKNGEATIKIIQNEDDQAVPNENATTSVNTPDITTDPKFSMPTPLDPDNTNKGYSNDTTSPIKANGSITAELPIHPNPVVAEQQHEHEFSQQSSRQGSPRGRGRRGRGHYRGQSRRQGRGAGRGQPGV